MNSGLNGNIVRLFNDRGACLAAAVLYEGIRPGVIELPTGAWNDPADPVREDSLEVHGNPNVLTRFPAYSKTAGSGSGPSFLFTATAEPAARHRVRQP